MDRTADSRWLTSYNSAYIDGPSVNALRQALLYWHCHALLQAQMQLFGALPAWGSRPRPLPPLGGSLPNKLGSTEAGAMFEIMTLLGLASHCPVKS